MNDSVFQLYPSPAAERPLRGLFLSHNLRQYYEASGQCFLYSNFVSSIDGRAQVILQTDDPGFADLRQWRQDQGIHPQPDIAIISGSLNFPIPDILTAGGRKVIVFTPANPDPKRVAEIEAKAGQVVIAGEKWVDAAALVLKSSSPSTRFVNL